MHLSRRLGHMKGRAASAKAGIGMLTAAHEFCSGLVANAAVFVDAEGLYVGASEGLVVVGSAGGLFEMRGNAVGAEVDALRAAFAEAVRTSAVAPIADLPKVIHYFSYFPYLSLLLSSRPYSPTIQRQFPCLCP